MIYGLSQIRCKEVINIINGEKLGFVDDIEFNSETGKISSFVIMGRKRLWGILGKDDDIIISVSDIELIGTDTLLVRYTETKQKKKFSIHRFFE